MKFDDLIINYLGEFGTYQKVQFLLVCLPTIITAMHALSWTFAGKSDPHRCRLPNEPYNASYWGADKNLFVPTDCTDLETHPSYKHCPYQACRLNNQSTDTNGCPNGYIFDHSEMNWSALERWEIVCDWHVLKAVIQSLYYIGQMIGSLVFGFLGDRIGRKKVFIIAILIQIVAGAGMAVAPNWIVYSIMRIAVGSAHPGIFVIAVVIGMELVGPKKRKLAAVLTGMFFSFGQVILGILAYFIRDYQHLQAAVALPALIFTVYWWIIPESARWLVSQKRYNEADAVLQRAAKINKTQLPPNWWDEIEITATEESTKTVAAVHNRKHNFLDLLRTPKLRRISLVAFFCWPVVSMVYYGLSMNPNVLGGNLYLNFIFGGLMEIPAVLIVYLLVDRVGRKPLLAGGYLIASACALSNLVMGDEAHWFIALAQFLLAKGAITATYATIYTFTPELFPTVIRNTAMGVCSMMARLGAILASYISMWLVEVMGKNVVIIPFSTLGIVAAIMALVFLPETMGQPLPETVEEVEGSLTTHELQPLQSGKASPVGKSE
ncbi:sugar transporter domain-containing protein [Ditylenchus destructor]|nr:sugar transporter domain-containing protein [Ditylenchus destructor]